MSLGNWFSSVECDHFVVLEDGFNVLLTLNNLVEWRVSELIKREFGFLNMWHHLAVFRLGPPFAHCEDIAGLAELRENQIAVFVEALEFLAEAATQGKGLDRDFE